MSKRVNLFVVGKSKSGTTALYEYLKHHEQIDVSAVKEPRFFCTDLSNARKVNKVHYPYRTKKAYHNLYKFDDDKEYYADFSPSYLPSTVAANNIYQYNPDAKIIALFREPISFLHSVHRELLKASKEDIFSFEEALAKEKERKQTNSGHFVPHAFALTYSEGARYSEQLQRYLDVFPRKQIKVILYEDFKQDNQRIVDELCDFLDIERIRIKKEQVNVGKEIVHPNIRKFFQTPESKRVIHFFLPICIRKTLGKAFNKITLQDSKQKPSIDSDLWYKLMKRFKPEVVKLNKLLHEHNLIEKEKDVVTFWGYDKI